ncbi:MAG: hypothetical protein ACP5K3_00475, partial [Candidatus Micrarchaeia archaeon]
MKKQRHVKKYASPNSKKAQSVIEYLITYSWAILIAAIIVSILYLFVFAPSAIAPNTCSFAYGAYCQDMVLGSNATSSKVALFLTNTQQYPIVNPSISLNITNIGIVQGKCIPSYVAPGGAIICNVTLPTKAITMGTLVSGRLYLIAIPCPSGSITSCSSGKPQTYTGSFNSRSSPLLTGTSLTISLQAANATSATGIPDLLVANVKLLGYPISGATVNFTASQAVKISPNPATTDSNGNART